MSRVSMDLANDKRIQALAWTFFAFHFSFHVMAEEISELDSVDNGGVSELAIFEHKLTMNMPRGWHLAFKQQEENMFRAEFVPARQSVLGWQSLLCIQSFRGLGGKIEPDLFLEALVARYRESCLGNVVFNKLSIEPSGYPEATAILGCSSMVSSHGLYKRERNAPSLPSGEVGFYRVFQAGEMLYLIHKSSRREKFSSQSLPLTQENFQSFMEGFSLPTIK